MEFCIIHTTTALREDAEHIAYTLVEQHLAACVQIQEIHSIYRWKNQIEKTSEFLLHIKTRRQLFPEVEKSLKNIHPYEVPEIVMVPIENGLEDYLQWIRENVSAQSGLSGGKG